MAMAVVLSLNESLGMLTNLLYKCVSAYLCVIERESKRKDDRKTRQKTTRQNLQTYSCSVLVAVCSYAIADHKHSSPGDGLSLFRVNVCM